MSQLKREQTVWSKDKYSLLVLAKELKWINKNPAATWPSFLPDKDAPYG